MQYFKHLLKSVQIQIIFFLYLLHTIRYALEQ